MTWRAISVRSYILADEMGLGKTVELLLCVLAHRYEPPQPPGGTRGVTSQAQQQQQLQPRQLGVKPEHDEAKVINRNREVGGGGDEEKGNRGGAGGEECGDVDHVDMTVVNCVCGATCDDEDYPYEGMWLACDECDEWSHARYGPGRYRSPLHGMPFKSGIDGSKRMSMTWRAISARP